MLTAQTETIMQILMISVSVLLVPVVVALLVVLFKAAFFIHSLSDFLRIVSYEFLPIVKELRLFVDHLQEIGERTASGVREVSHYWQNTIPWIQKGFNKVKTGTLSVVGGLKRSYK